MRIVKHTDSAYQSFRRRLDRRAEPTPEVRATVQAILEEVGKRGDAALVELTAKFGGPQLKASTLRVDPAEMAEAWTGLAPEVRRALRASHRNVRSFAKKSLRRNWTMRNAQGALVGERFDPFHRVGIYVPGGTAPLVSTALMTCTLAAAAGVPEVVAVTPAGPQGRCAPALLAALHLAGATEVYRVGGAQAVAALALGTKTIRPVAKVFGPGNSYVVEAKRQLFGTVAVDLLPGPSEVMVLADQEAEAAWVAADLLAQAEHGRDSAAILLTDSAALLRRVEEEIQAQAATLSRGAMLQDSLREAALVLVPSIEEAVEICNAWSPEHVSLQVRQPAAWLPRLRTAGAVFLGGYSPVAAGDFLAGPSHELPTGGAGKSFGGLTADQFQRRTSVVQFDRASLARSLPVVQTFSHIEGLDAHGRSVALRLERPRR